MMEIMAKRMKAINERINGKRDLAAIKSDAEVIASHAPHSCICFQREAHKSRLMPSGRSGRTGPILSVRQPRSKPKARS